MKEPNKKGNRGDKKASREAYRVEDAHLEAFTHTMQETWFNKHGLTRFMRFILTIGIAFLASTMFVQGNNREQCENSKPFLRSYATFILTAAQSREKAAKTDDDPNAKRIDTDTAKAYRNQYLLIQPGIDQNCKDTYPIIPGLGL